MNPFASNVAERCDPVGESLAALCQFRAVSPSGRPVVMFGLTVPLADVDSARDDAQRSLWLTATALVLLGTVAAWLLARSLSLPLMRLTHAARQIAAGDYRQPTDQHCLQVLTSDPKSDEITLLAQAFDAMRERVAESTSALSSARPFLPFHPGLHLGAILRSQGHRIMVKGVAAKPTRRIRRERRP